MNQRVAALREQSVSTHPYLEAERAVLLTEAYEKYEGKVSVPMLRALSFAHILRHKRIGIEPGELIVGERGSAPQATPTFPEICCHTQDDLDTLDSREKIAYRVDGDMKRVYAQRIAPFWRGRALRDRILEAMTPQWKACFEAGIFTEFMEQRAPGHTVAGGAMYEKGFGGFKKELEGYLAQLDESDAQGQARGEQMRAMIVCADAIVELAHRYADLAEKMALREADTDRARELRTVAQVCRWVPENPPRNFHEVLQMYWFAHIGVITELNTWDSFNPGRLDQHLIPFYRADMERGKSREELMELLECFWVKFNNQPAPAKVGVTAAESGTYTDFANINIGGMTAQGEDGSNEVSYMLLEAIDDMHTLQPSTNIQLCRKNPDAFLRAACRVIAKGYGFPSVFNADAVVQELMNQGKSLEDARQGGTSGCVEAGAFGHEAYILTGYFNLVKILEITLNGGKDPRTGKQLGLPIPGDFADFEALMAAYEAQVKHFVDIKAAGNDTIEDLFAAQMPAPFLSLMVEDCAKKGVDYNAGGARYNTSYIQGVGIGTLTDSVCALKKAVYDDKILTLEQMKQALADNFTDRVLRERMLHRMPKYGNDDDVADAMMRRLFGLYHDAVEGRPNRRGGCYHIDMLPTTCHVYFGEVTGATPDGRLAGTPVSEGISPVQGADAHGPTAVVKSAAQMDHLHTGGTLLNMKFTPSLLKGRGIEQLMALIRAYFLMNGHHVQFNVVDRETLRRAQKAPEEYRSLIVRVAGYSDYFCNLTPALQNEIIARTEHENF
ncbi:MAG: glycyl radical protein [Eubacteriales bacterium]|nr:glycyl radical protein [Eubacteriales bacterium]